jgi:hypothetical protein
VPCLGPTSSGSNLGHDHEIDSDTPVFLTILRSWTFHTRLQGPYLLPLFATTQSEQTPCKPSALMSRATPRVFDERLGLKNLITDSLPTLGIEEV